MVIDVMILNAKTMISLASFSRLRAMTTGGERVPRFDHYGNGKCARAGWLFVSGSTSATP